MDTFSQRKLLHSQAEYIQAARRMMYLVKAADLTLESLYAGRALRRAIWRYEALWLPLLAAVADAPGRAAPTRVWRKPAFATTVDEIRAKNFSKGGLWLRRDTVVPPLDIAWVWHCHRLDPEAFARDMEALGGAHVDAGDDSGGGGGGGDEGEAQEGERGEESGPRGTAAFMRVAGGTTLETAFRFSDGEDAQSKATRRLWDIVYPHESYMPGYMLNHTYDEEQSLKRQHITSYTNEMNRASFRSLLTYDLEYAASLQKAFVYQIVDEDKPERAEHFETTPYLTRAYDRYLKFLALHARHPDVLLVPMNDINIMWHMHLSCTEEYTHDCHLLLGHIMKHDSIAVDKRRQDAVRAMDEGRGTDDDEATLEEDELQDILEKRSRGVAIKETKALWESAYGDEPRYDLEDTRYRGLPKGDRGGFCQMFERLNGTTTDISWPETLGRMVAAVLVVIAGMAVMGWAFVKTMLKHGRYIMGMPVGGGLIAVGAYIFLAIPISRPLSSDSRYWLEKSYKQTHDPLPPYLVPTSKKLR